MKVRLLSLPLFLILILIFISSLCFPMAQRPSQRPYIIRVAVINGADKFRLKIVGPYAIVSPNTFEELMKGAYLHEVDVEPDFSGIKIGNNLIGIFGIKILPEKDSSILIDGRKFRGSIDIIRLQDMKLLAVNYIDVEDYLYGVLYHEVSHRWPMEVLKAQAIASRTYAAYQSLINKDKDFDLTSDIYSQVYGGRTSEKARSNRAVILTRGRVLKFNGQVFPAYYHATCGGKTSDADTLWKIDLLPLKGKACPYCFDSPHLRWTKEIPILEIEEKLENNGFSTGGILNIQVLDRDSANRILNVKIEGREASFTISGNKFRLLLGANIIRSTNFEISFKNDKMKFEGFGWGHGVGMCQWGAYHMARIGKTAEEILKFYYTGAEIGALE